MRLSQIKNALGWARTPNRRPDDRPHVAIVGGGFAGLHAVKTLADAPVRFTLIDRNNFHTFQPLLYQVATAALEPEDVGHAFREVLRTCPNGRFRLGTVTGIDPERKEITFEEGPSLGFDYCLLAPGAISNDFGVPGVDEHAIPLKNMSDAVRIKHHLLRQLESVDADPARADEALAQIVVVGGGPTGVEMAGALTELFDFVFEDDYPELELQNVRVTLLEMTDQLLPGFGGRIPGYTQRTLERRGVEVRLEALVEEVREEAVVLEGGEAVPTRTLIWAAGVRAHPLLGTLDVELTEGGRVLTEPDLSIPAHPDIYVAGDGAACDTDDPRTPHPQLAQVAIQQGRHAARQILRRISGKETEAFRYADLGVMATIGRRAAVAEFPTGARVKGTVAWLLWVFVHVMQLVGFRNRVSVFLTWVYSYFTYDRAARLLLDDVHAGSEHAHVRA